MPKCLLTRQALLTHSAVDLDLVCQVRIRDFPVVQPHSLTGPLGAAVAIGGASCPLLESSRVGSSGRGLEGDYTE